ncbi:MAG: hypothetical protein ACREH5_02220 [Candidatus Omnitrophota bacterium]
MKALFKRERLFDVIFWAVPTAVLVWAYFYLAYEHSTLALWGRVVHENGKVTLSETIFYADHFVREILVCVLSGSIIAFAFLLHAPAAPRTVIRPLRRTASIFFLSALIFLAVAVLAAVWKKGAGHVWQDLLQFRIREGEISFGSHWKGHFLHVLFIFVFSIGLSFLYRGAAGRPVIGPGRQASALILVWASLFLVLELVFSGAGEALSAPRYLAHELREIVTHAGITAPLCFAVLLRAERGPQEERDGPDAVHGELVLKALFCFFIAFLIPVFICLQLKGVDVLSLAQKQTNFFDLLASHSFEHTLDYVFTPLIALAAYFFFRRA